MHVQSGILQAMDSLRLVLLLLLVIPAASNAGTVLVGDIEIDPEGFFVHEPKQRLAQCLACHGQQAGGDSDFGPDVDFGTPALRGMSESYLLESLSAYQAGTRVHEEMSVIAAMLDEETMQFMARSFAGYDPLPFKSAAEIATLEENDKLFSQGQGIASQGIAQKGVPPCMACHGGAGEGSAVGPRLAGQNVEYIERQFKAFASGERRNPQSSTMQPAVNGMSEDDIRAVAHFYESLVSRD